jgi:hypothetical protein
MAKWIIVGVAIIFLGSIVLVKPVPVSSAPALDPTPAAVKIVCTVQRISDSGVYDVTGGSLGTFIAANFILTHNHFGFMPGRRSCDQLIVTDEAGHYWRWRATNVEFIALDAGTSLIGLPNKLLTPFAPLAASPSVPTPPVGSWLTVNYWDDNTQRLAHRDFQIIQIKDSIARLADPDLVINPGDSGGGAYYNGKLVGNTWSIDLTSDRRAAGSFNIALLPAQVRGYLK